MIINALSACLLSHVVSNDIKHWACKQLVSLYDLKMPKAKYVNTYQYFGI